MAKKRETGANAKILKSLQKYCWARNISDKFQIGLPDNLVCYQGLTMGMELKAVSSIPENGWAPLKSDHCFSKPQIRELKSIETHGGVGLGLLVCGSYLFWFLPSEINEFGQVNCNELLKLHQFIKKGTSGDWDSIIEVLCRFRSYHNNKERSMNGS